MSDTVIIAETAPAETGYRFSWGLAIAGGVAATAVTFFLLTLGAGVGLLLVNPATGEGPSAPVFLNAGALYFLFAQAFGFVVGGHLAGTLLGPVAETRRQEDVRSAAHGLISWATAVLATLTMLAIIGLSAANTGATTAAIYGASAVSADTTASQSTYVVDRLFEPANGGALPADTSAMRDEAGRIVMAGMPTLAIAPASDRARLVALVSRGTGLAPADAETRVAAVEADTEAKLRVAADVARKTASYASMWLAASLLVGAILAMLSALMARHEDNRRGFLTRRTVAA